MLKYVFTYSFLVLCSAAIAQDTKDGQTKIEILRTDELVYNQERGRFQICRGNVRFKQDAMLMDCDSAYFYEEKNKIEAFGKIYIRQRDSLDLWGGYLEYDGDTRLAKVSKGVKLTDGKMVLNTAQLNYDMVDKVGYYTTGGTTINGQDTLFSERGTYYSRSKDLFFKDSVKLTNPEYTMTSDTLKYNTLTKLATFLGPTFIRSEENIIYCQYGWYNTQSNISQFSKGAYIEGVDNKLIADSMMYYRNTGLGEAFGTIKLVDTLEKITITGDYGRYDRLTKTTLITGNPLATKNVEDDSFYLKADTFVDLADTSSGQKRLLKAFRGVKVYKSDLQAVADSLVYNFTDSMISFFTNPIVWTDSNQITGDTIHIFRNQDGIKRLEAYANGFVIEKDVNGFFNQIKGKHLEAFFNAGKIYRVDVDGNGQSVYYAREDSVKYSGVNEVVCGKMVIHIDTAKSIRSIVFKSKPKAVFYPLESFPTEKSTLQGFRWDFVLRPTQFSFF